MKHEWLFWLIMSPAIVVGVVIFGVALWATRSEEAYRRAMSPVSERVADHERTQET